MRPMKDNMSNQTKIVIEEVEKIVGRDLTNGEIVNMSYALSFFSNGSYNAGYADGARDMRKTAYDNGYQDAYNDHAGDWEPMV